MNNNIINLLIIFFIFIIIYYIYNLYFSIYEPMSNCDKTNDYLKQDINKIDDNLNNNTKQINKLEQDIKIINENIENNKKNIEDQKNQIIELSKAMIPMHKSNIHKVGIDNPEDIKPENFI